MARPGDILSRTITREAAATGTGVAGLVTADFTVTAWLNGVSFVITKSFTSLGSGEYRFTYTLPSTPGIVDIRIVAASGTDIIWPGKFSEEVETQDLASIASVNRPSAILAATARIGQEFALTLFYNNYDEIEVTIVEADGVTPVDLSAWDTWRFGIKNDDQTAEGSALPFIQTTGITGDVDGLLRIIIAENAAFFAALTATFLVPGRILYYSAEGNQGADATKTRTVLHGRVTIVRKET